MVQLEIKLNNKNLEQVKSFKYLGSILSSNGYCSVEIKSCIMLPKIALNSRRELLSKSLGIKLRKRMIKYGMCFCMDQSRGH